MIDKFDYAEPTCATCGGKEFYNPSPDDPIERIDVRRVLDKVDSLFAKNDYKGAGAMLEHWLGEAIGLKDKRGELTIQSELVGYYRKQNDREMGLKAISGALSLVRELEQEERVSGATVFINCATAYKAFSMPNESLALFERAEKAYENLLKKTDARFAGLYNNMALTYVDLKKYDLAEASYQKALKVMESQPGGEADTAITYVNMAHMYEDLGKEEKILECMTMAYELLVKEGVVHDGYYAFVLSKCAPSFGYFGFTDVYEEFTEEAKRIYEGA